MRHYCTLFDHNYLVKGLSLVKSLETYAGDYHLWLLCMSDKAYELLSKMNLPHVTLISLEDFEDQELREVKKTRSFVEYCWTLTPSLPTYVFKKRPELQEVSYIDADCFFFSSPEAVFEEMAGKDVLIIEHRYSPDLQFLEKTSGRFNVGLVVFKNTTNGRRVLEDWRKKCNEWCYYRNEDGKMGDQLYLDAWPNEFDDVHISNHLGACVAPWNIRNYEVKNSNGQVMIDNYPLVFYHYHALEHFSNGTITPARNYDFTPAVLQGIYQPYQNALNESLKLVRSIDKNFSDGILNTSEGTKSFYKRAKRKFRKPYRWAKDLIFGPLEVKVQNCPVCSSSSKFTQWLYDDRYGYPGQFAQYTCADCDHKFLDANFSEKDLGELYTQYYPRSTVDIDSVKALDYEDNFQSWLAGEKRAYSCVPENSRVLDIGCGYGETLLFHQSRGCEAYGVEADHNAQKAKDKLGLNIHVGVFKEGLFEENFFDYVTMDQVIEHVTEPEKVLSEIHKVLKPGGKLIMTTPNANGWGTKFFGEKWINWHVPYHLHHFSKKSMKVLAKKSGYDVDKMETLTSSEWLYYQELHSMNFPEQGQASQFWAPYRRESTDEPSRMGKISQKLIYKSHKYKVNHLLTRTFDGLSLGDNLLVELTCQK